MREDRAMTSTAIKYQYGIGILRKAIAEWTRNDTEADCLRESIKAIERAAFRAKTTENNKDDWGTPPEVIDAVRRCHPNGITLDVAAHDNNHVAKRYYSSEGQTQSWATDGIAWCNPPFSHKMEFANAFAAAGEQPRCILIGGTESTKANMIARDAATCIVRFRRRLKFVGAPSSATFDTRLFFAGGMRMTEKVVDNFASVANVEVVR